MLVPLSVPDDVFINELDKRERVNVLVFVFGFTMTIALLVPFILKHPAIRSTIPSGAGTLRRAASQVLFL